MHPVNKDLSIFYPDKSFLKAALSHTERFYHRTMKRNAGLKGIINKKIMIRFFVVCNEFDT